MARYFQWFSFARMLAVMKKEFIQLKRDRLTFAMVIGVPCMQLMLFGFAINTDPKHLPTVIVSHEQSPMVRSFASALEISGYFDVVAPNATLNEANRLLREGKVQFIVQIPPDFTRKMIRGEHPQILLDADASDPMATSNAVAALLALKPRVFGDDLKGALLFRSEAASSFELIVHRRYNPEGLTTWNIVPGLMGVILTMTMMMMTGLALTREVERGTIENLLATPVQPIEVMIGKIMPFILIGLIQVLLILSAAKLIFDVPFVGSFLLLLSSVLVFIVANLVVGITVSSIARNQLQALQMSFFFFLPSILLSGFMFPFRGMPFWAQTIGEVLPLTHFLRLIRGIMLKGHGITETWQHLSPLLIFIVIVLAIGLKRFRRTLD